MVILVTSVRRLGAMLAMVAGAMLGLPVVAGAAVPQIRSVTIDPTSPVVGQTLTAQATAVGPPAPTVRFEWLRCAGDLQLPCEEFLALGPSYTATAADAGRGLAVRVTASNEAGTDSRVVMTAAVQAPAAVTAVTITGIPNVGRLLTAHGDVSGYPAPVVTYQWQRCEAGEQPPCTPIASATAPSYEVSPSDAGRRLAVRVTAVNLSGGATTLSSPTEPVPMPPTGGSTSPTRGSAFDQSGRLPRLTSEYIPLRYLRPFPVVRIKGILVKGGARVTLLRVTAPRGSRVVATCKRLGCPLRRRTMDVGRIREFEQYLPAGTRITIRVARPGLIGKYVDITIRDGKAPKRRDACVLPDSPQPAKCPAP